MATLFIIKDSWHFILSALTSSLLTSTCQMTFFWGEFTEESTIRGGGGWGYAYSSSN